MPPAPAAGSKQAASLAEEDAAINVRLLTQVSSLLKGKQPLFKALAQSFLAVADAAQNGSLEDALAAQANFLRDADALELQLARLAAADAAAAREQAGCAAKRAQLERQVAGVLADIEARKRELHAARVERQHREEYEVVRALIAQQPPRAATQAAIDAERARAEALRGEQRRHAAALEARRRAFALLLRCVEELQRAGAGGADDDGGDAAAAVGGGGGGPAAMQVDG